MFFEASWQKCPNRALTLLAEELLAVSSRTPYTELKLVVLSTADEAPQSLPLLKNITFFWL